jgi:hypothetical protein
VSDSNRPALVRAGPLHRTNLNSGVVTVWARAQALSGYGGHHDRIRLSVTVQDGLLTPRQGPVSPLGPQVMNRAQEGGLQA